MRWIQHVGEGSAASAWAFGRLIRSGDWTGEIVTAYDVDSRTNDTRDRNFDFSRKSGQAGVSLRNSSFVLGPRLVVANAGLDFTLRRDAFDTGLMKASPDLGRVVGYDFGMTALPDRRYSAGAFAARTDTVMPMLFGAARDQRTERRGAVIKLAGPILHSTLEWTRLSFESHARTDRGVRAEGEERDVLAYTGTRRSARQNLFIEHRRERRRDLVFPELSFPFQLTSVRHRVVLDEDHDDRTLTSTLGFNRRGGALQRDHVQGETRLDYRLRPRLNSRSTYSLEQIDSAPIRRIRQGADLQLQHRLYDSLFTTAGLRVARDGLLTGERRLFGKSLLVEYRKQLPAKGLLSATAGGSWEGEDDRFDDRADVILDEAHVARVGAPFRLTRARVIATSIVASNAAGTVVFQEGFDYQLRSFGEFVEIGVLPEGRIADGQTVLVDYRIALSPFTKTSTRQRQLDLSVDYGWFVPYLRISGADRELLEGTDDGSVFDHRSRAVGVRLRRDRNRLRLMLRSERRTEEARNLSFDSLQFGEVVSFSLQTGRVMTVSLDEVFSNFHVPVRRESRGSANVDFRWQATPVLSLRAMSVARLRRDSLGFDEDFYQAGIESRWERQVLFLSALVTRDWGVRAGSEFVGMQVSIRATRYF